MSFPGCNNTARTVWSGSQPHRTLSLGTRRIEPQCGNKALGTRLPGRGEGAIHAGDIMGLDYNDGVKTNYADHPITACPFCKMALRPQGIGVVSHFNKHVRLRDCTRAEATAIIRGWRGLPPEETR